MTGAICYLSLVALRAEPSGKAEMVNQLLFGDLTEITETYDHWLKIRTLHDGYEGWCDRKQLFPLSDETLEVLKGSSVRVITDSTGLLSTQGKPGLRVVMGSSLYMLSNDLIAGPDGDYYLTEGEIGLPEMNHPNEIAETASLYLNSPYLWGGRSPFGIDCSGLVQMVFRIRGISLKRDASQQALQGTLVNLIEESRVGDVAFFDNDDGHIVHTGIITGRGTIIHASGEVRIDPLDHHGIFNKKEGRYSHKLRVIKRFTDV